MAINLDRPAEAALAAALKNLKETSNWSLTELGELLDMDRMAAWRLITGERAASESLLLSIRYNLPVLAREVDAVEAERREARLAKLHQRREAVASR